MNRHNVVFLDRDGVIIEHVPYISREEDVRLLASAAEAIQCLNALGIPVVVKQRWCHLRRQRTRLA